MSQPAFLSRRQLLQHTACGFGSLALSALAHRQAAGAADKANNPLAARQPHLPPRAKRVIFLFMQGGPSHVDTFDHKPLLMQRDGQSFDFEDDRVQA